MLHRLLQERDADPRGDEAEDRIGVRRRLGDVGVKPGRLTAPHQRIADAYDAGPRIGDEGLLGETFEVDHLLGGQRAVRRQGEDHRLGS